MKSPARQSLGTRVSTPGTSGAMITQKTMSPKTTTLTSTPVKPKITYEMRLAEYKKSREHMNYLKQREAILMAIQKNKSMKQEKILKITK